MKKAIVPSYVVALLLIGFSGCEKNSGEAVVVGKEHIDAVLPTAETPNAKSAPGPDEKLRPVADDEIAVDGYVMKPEARGTSRDPRALKHEQWIVTVRMLDNGSTFQVPCRSSKMGEIARERPGSKSGIARASTPEPFGPLRLSRN
jgi:hypothetical protein